MLTILKRLWGAIRSPSAYYSLGFLTLGGFICGILFWGGFNIALEATNTETFCIGCHEMEANVYADLQTTVHWNNGSGVRAQCEDCHVPHEGTDKIARKIAASKEVYGWLFGTIDTEEEFEAHCLTMARREWAPASPTACPTRGSKPLPSTAAQCPSPSSGQEADDLRGYLADLPPRE